MKMISRRDFLKASAVVGATAAMTACGGSSSSTAASTASSAAASSTAASAAGSANIGVCIYQFADNFMTLYRTDLEEYLKDMGYSVTIMDGKNDQNTQTEQINTFLQQGVDVLIINPVQTTSAQTIVDTVSPSGTPIVFINREPDKSVLDSYAGKCCYVGADARQSGTYQGQLILETETQGDINGDGKITYIMCKGDPENIDAQYRTEYSIKALTMKARKSSACTSTWTTGIRPPLSRTLQTLCLSTAIRSKSSSATTTQWHWALCSPSSRPAAPSARTSIWSASMHWPRLFRTFWTAT